MDNAATFLPPARNLLDLANGGAGFNRSISLAEYTKDNTILFFDRRRFNRLYSFEARDDLDSACSDLLRHWRAYRTRMVDRHIVPFTFKHRFAKYQKQHYMNFKYEGRKRLTNVYDRMCYLNMFGKCPNFERDLVMYIAKFLLPSEQQHNMYYGYQGMSVAAAIDVTYVQPIIDGEVCSKAEMHTHLNPYVHPDDLLEDGWDAQSTDSDAQSFGSDSDWAGL